MEKVCGRCKVSKVAAAFPKCSARQDGIGVWCRACQHEYMAAWRSANKPLIDAAKQRRKESGKSARDVANYRRRHADRVAVYAEKHRRPRRKAMSQEERRARKRLWKKNNRLLQKVYKHRNRAKRRAAAGSHTKSEIAALLLKQRRRCAVCQTPLDASYEVDHIIPMARCGSNSIENIQILCRPCNRHKQARHPMEFMQSRGFLL